MRLGWAKLLKRLFEIDMEHCPNCGGDLNIIDALLEQPVIERILAHLGLQARAPPRAPARGQRLGRWGPCRKFDETGRPAHTVVEVFNNLARVSMSTMNFSVPDDVKEAFNATFEGQNKSAIVTDLLREAVERAKKRELQKLAVERILARRASAPVVTQEDIDAARQAGRP